MSKSLALVAAVAVIVCAFAMIMPATDATVADIPDGVVEYESEVTLATDGAEYYVPTTATSATITLASNYNAVVYLPVGASITVNGAGGATGTVTVYVATSATQYDNATGITLTGESGSTKITAESANGQYSYTVGASPALTVGNAVVISTSGSASTYYSADSVPSTIVLAGVDTSVMFPATTIDGTVTVNGTDGSNKVVNSITIADMAVTTAIQIAGGASGALNLNAGAWSAGTLTVNQGQITATSSVTQTTGINAYANKAMGESNTVLASEVSTFTSVTNLYAYGNVANNQTIDKTTGIAAIYAVNADITAFTVTSSNKVIGTISVEGTMTLTVGDSTITIPTAIGDGTVSASLTLVSGSFATAADTTTVNKSSDLTVSSGATLDISAASAMTVNGNLNVYGTIKSTDSISITVGSKTDGTTEQNYTGSFRAFSGAKMSGNVTVTGTGTIDLSGMSGTKYVTGVTVGDETYFQSQNVVVVDYYDVDNNSEITINGSLSIPENTTMTIRDGSTVTVNGVTSVIDIKGTLIVEAGAFFTVTSAKNVDVYGTIDSEGDMDLNGMVEIKNGGSVTSVGTLDTDAGSKFTVAAGGELAINGQFYIQEITNKGAITLDEAVMTGASTISMAANGATIDIVSFTTDSDSSMALEIQDVIKDTATPVNTVTLTIAASGANTGLGDIYVTSSVTKDDEKNDVYSLDISGSPSIIDERESSGTAPANTIAVSGSGMTVNNELILGEDISFTVSSGKLTVAGSIDATADNSGIVATGTIDVAGMITARNNSGLSDDSINAAFYKLKSENGSATYEYYTSLKYAVENSGATDIETLGTLVVKEDITVATGITVENSGSLQIGDSDNRGITVSFDSGAILRGDSVTVMATLEFDDVKNCRATVYSDVRIDNEPAVTYTNVYTALANAADGSTVTITSEQGVVIDADITVKAGVTLSVPAGKSISVNNDVTVTVDGTVIAYSGINGTFAEKESATAAALVVNGIVMTGESGALSDLYNNYKTPGAYYQVSNDQGSYTYISPVATAAEYAQDAGTISVFGKNTVGDVAFTGTEDETVEVVVETGAELKAGTVTLSFATMTVNDARFDGTVSSELGSVTVVNTKNLSFAASVDTDDVKHFAVAGTPAQKDTSATAPKSAVTVATGTVEAAGTTENPFDIKGTEFDIASGTAMTVVGVMVAEDLTVNGTMTVGNDAQLEVENNLVVLGTFTVAEADTENSLGAGQASAVYVYVGVDAETLGAAATLTADSLGNGVRAIYVSAGSTVTEDLIDGMPSTEFFVEDALYMTVYVNGYTIEISTIGTPEMDGALVEAWQYDDNGTMKDITTSNDKNVGDVAAVYGKMKYDVYNVKIIVDSGFSDIYIDGNLVASKGISAGLNNVVIQLSAGTHTVSYKLSNGWAGDIEISFDGKTATDGSFTIDSSMPFENETYNLVLTGAVATGNTAPASTSGDDGMGLTDYLLIILVILIVVMAIMVALRLMRS